MATSIDSPASGFVEREVEPNGKTATRPANCTSLHLVFVMEAAAYDELYADWLADPADFYCRLTDGTEVEEATITWTQVTAGTQCGIVVFTWNNTQLDTLDFAGQTVTTQYNDSRALPTTHGYFWVHIINGSTATNPIRESAFNYTIADVATVTASGTQGVVGDLPIAVGVNVSSVRDYVSGGDSTPTFGFGQGIPGATPLTNAGFAYGAPLTSGGSWSATLNTDANTNVNKVTLGVLFAGDGSGGTTFTTVVKDTVVVTAAQPGQEVAGLRPGDRIETMTDLWRIGYRGTVRQDGIRLTDQAIPTTFDIPVTRFRALADGFNQCWDFVTFYRLFKYERDLADTASAYDALLRALQLRFTLADSLVLADAAVAQYLRQPALTDDLAVVDAVLVNSLFLITKTSDDYARVRDNVIATYIESEGEPATTYNKLLVDGSDVNDAWLAGVYRFTGQQLADNVRAWDRMTPLRLVARTVTESIAVDDKRNLPAAPQITVDVVGEVIHIDIAGYDIDIEIRPSGA
jgi:hypothetical protein